MGKKKAKPNAFSVFMREYLEKERRAGRRYPQDQWASIAKPHFDVLTPDQKEQYKQMAKGMLTRVYMVQPKYTSQGVPLEQVEREQRELAENKRYMERKVQNIVENGFLDNDIKMRPFVFIMANYFYKTSTGMYSPAEVAVAKFNFEDAITQFYHTFVNPETVQIGYAFEAKDRSERIHRLPPPPRAMGERNYETIYAGILDVLGARPGQKYDKDDDRRPCVFIRNEEKSMIESILDQLSNEQWKHTFDVFDLELLFNILKNKVDTVEGGERLRVTVTNAFIERDQYDTTPNISCDFHENEDATRHCALSCVRRWFFLFADHICEKIGVKLVAGKHLPGNVVLAPPQPFEEDQIEERKQIDHRDDCSYTGYSKFASDSDSSDSDY